MKHIPIGIIMDFLCITYRVTYSHTYFKYASIWAWKINFPIPIHFLLIYLSIYMLHSIVYNSRYEQKEHQIEWLTRRIPQQSKHRNENNALLHWMLEVYVYSVRCKKWMVCRIVCIHSIQSRYDSQTTREWWTTYTNKSWHDMTWVCTAKSINNMFQMKHKKI